MTAAEVVERFQTLAAAYPDVAETFLTARALWHDSVDLARVAGDGFGRLCDLIEARQGRPLVATERDVLRALLRSPVTPREAASMPAADA